MMEIKKMTLLLTLVWATTALQAQEERWPSLPGLGYNDQSIALINEESFYGLASASLLSLGVSEWVNKTPSLNFYNARTGMYGTTGGYVMQANVGLEKQLTHWFGIGLELNNEYWFYPEEMGWGAGLNTYYRWYAWGKKRWSPFMEYGAGIFRGMTPFPPDGQKFSFHLTTTVGVEHTLPNQDRVRVGYGHLHQSTNDIIVPNPGEDGNGFTATYSWFWK